MSIGIVIGTLVVGLLVGFLIGARTRQIANKIRAIGKALASLASLIRMAEADPGAQAGEATGDDADEPEEEEGKDADKEKDALEDFLQTEEVPGLDDHEDLEVSPVIMYQIKLSKDAQRLQMQREALAAEGMTEEEIEARLAAGDAGVSGGGGRPNALALLLSVGARVTPAGKNKDDAAKKREEMRRKARNINVFLSKTLDIDTRLAPPKDFSKGGRRQNAYDVARGTKLNPVGGWARKRQVAATVQAKSARRIYRDNKAQVDLTLKPIMDKASDDAPEENVAGAAVPHEVNDGEEVGEDAEGEEGGSEEEGEENEEEENLAA